MEKMEGEMDLKNFMAKTEEMNPSYNEDDLQSESEATVGKCTDKGSIVWPWMGVIANIPVDAAGPKLKNHWVGQGYNPSKVHPLSDTGFAIVEFDKDWEGFKNAMAFEKAFEIDDHGRKAWYGNSHRCEEDKVYGWVARKAEYYGNDIIGEHLRNNGNLKTLSQIIISDKRTVTALIRNLINELELRKKECEDRINVNVMGETEETNRSFIEEMKKMQYICRNELIHLRAKQFNQRQALIDTERKKLDNLNKKMEKEKEELHKKTAQVKAKLVKKLALEMQIVSLRGAIEVIKLMSDEESIQMVQKFEKELKDKEETLEGMQ